MKMNKNIFLLVLNIVHTLMIVSLWSVVIMGGLDDGSNILLVAAIIIITLLASIGMWLLYALPSPKAAVIILRIQSVLKTVFIACLAFVLMILLLAIQECGHSIGDNPTPVPLGEKMKIIIPFVSAIFLSVFYLVIYQILLVFINKKKVNKPIMIIAFIVNVVLGIFSLIFMISSLVQLMGNNALIGIDIIGGLDGIGRYIFIVLLLLYTIVKGLSSFLLLKNVIKKKGE